MFKSIAGTGALLIVAFCIGVAAAPGDQTTAPVLKGSAAFGGFDQDRPGLRRLIQPQDLPPVTLSTTASAQGATRPDGVIPKVPEGLSHRASPVRAQSIRRRTATSSSPKAGPTGCACCACRGMTSPR